MNENLRAIQKELNAKKRETEELAKQVRQMKLKPKAERLVTAIISNDDVCKALEHFTNAEVDVIAEDNGVSRASVVRYAVLGGLEKYLGSLKYVDRSQAQAINKNLCETANVMQAILNELRSIGVNYNQLTKQVNTLRLQEENAKFGSSYYVDTMMRRIKAEDKAKKETVGVVNEVADLIDQYVDASARLGAELWRIHE